MRRGRRVHLRAHGDLPTRLRRANRLRGLGVRRIRRGLPRSLPMHRAGDGLRERPVPADHEPRPERPVRPRLRVPIWRLWPTRCLCRQRVGVRLPDGLSDDPLRAQRLLSDRGAGRTLHERRTMPHRLLLWALRTLLPRARRRRVHHRRALRAERPAVRPVGCLRRGAGLTVQQGLPMRRGRDTGQPSSVLRSWRMPGGSRRRSLLERRTVLLPDDRSDPLRTRRLPDRVVGTALPRLGGLHAALRPDGALHWKPLTPVGPRGVSRASRSRARRRAAPRRRSGRAHRAAPRSPAALGSGCRAGPATRSRRPGRAR